jgi:hypothetical protein
LDASKALGNRYALRLVTSLLQDVHSRFLTTGHIDENIPESVKKGLEALWALVRQPQSMSKIVKAILVAHTNKLNADLKQLVADLVIASNKTSIMPQAPVSAAATEPKEVLTLVASEAVAAFANLAKEARKLRVHTEESVSRNQKSKIKNQKSKKKKKHKGGVTAVTDL